MTDTVDTLMVVPARGGSRGIPGKNVKPLAGRPLIHWVLRAGVRAPNIDAIVVSGDHPDVESAVRAAGSDKIRYFRRSAETATDTASTESALQEVAARFACRTLVLVQATSPLLTPDELAGAVRHYHRSGADSLVSVVRQHRFTWTHDSEGWGQPVNYAPSARPRRQEFDGILVENGAVYICDRGGFEDHAARLFGRIATYEMAPDTYLELDEPTDWAMIETLVAERQRARNEPPATLRIVLCDIDGVLTDAGMYYSESGDELKKFSTYDGQAVALLQAAGLYVGLITREARALNAHRASKLGVDFLEQGAVDKVQVAATHLERLGLSWEHAAYIGDDIHDAALLARVGYGAAPRSAMPVAKAAANRVLDAPGGGGCLRELADALLRNQTHSAE